MTIINSQLGGKRPSGTITISSNTTTDVSDYEYAVTEVPTTAPAHYIEKTVDANGKAQNSSYLMDFSSFTDVGNYVFAYAYYNNTAVSGAVDLGSLTTVSGQLGCSSVFQGCTGITSVDLSGLTTVSGQRGCNSIFNGCTGITGAVDLGSLTTVSGQQGCYYMFNGCTGITSVDLSSLTTISGSSGCQYMFGSCISLKSLSFPALKTVYNDQVFWYMLQGVTGATVHFPSNLSSYNFSVGGTNTTILYDLPATNTLTGADTVTYTRNPKYDTGTALAWKVGAYGTTNFTPAYYTSGLTDPTVGTTI